VIAAVGDLMLDVTIAPEGELVPDDERDARIELGGGGQAANFCAWAASLGEPARLITRVGTDEAGRRLVWELEAAGVEVVGPRVPGRTGTIAVLVGRDGRRTFARQAGVSRGLREEDVAPAWLDGVRLLHVSAYALYGQSAPGALRAAGHARDSGALVSVDLSSAEDLRAFGGDRLADQLRWLRPELLFGTEREMGELLTPAGGLAKVPVVKLGALGCRVFDRRVPAPSVAVLDGTGAGDAFAAAFCVAYLDGATPLEAAGRAVLVGARAVTKLGARP
jgi:sugar/nucleoside kinase (ribokinase family)